MIIDELQIGRAHVRLSPSKPFDAGRIEAILSEVV
jgi:hypothetical protein